MAESIGIVLLAAGKGTRLKVSTAKPLCIATGKTLVDHVLEGVKAFTGNVGITSSLGIVVGHQKEKVQSHLEENYSSQKMQFAWQKEQLGTGHALQVYFEEIKEAWEQDYTLVVCADTPLINAEIYETLYKELKGSSSDAVCATFETSKPKGYGRIDKGDRGFSIIEEKDATTDQRLIKEVNSGVYIFKTAYIKEHLYNLKSENKSNEFYLTDLFSKESNVKACLFDDEQSFLGVNNLIQLEEAERVLSRRKVESLQLEGVRFINSSSVYIEKEVCIGKESIIYPNVTLIGCVEIGSNVTIEPGCVIKNSKISDNTIIKAYSYFEGANIGEKCAIGPMARLREGSEIGDTCKIGNFVETKKAILHKGSKVSHLSYVGDAQIGENTNIGCGFITCNYDGAQKHKTIIGKDSFIGSDCQVVAPIEIGDESYVGSGSTITKNVPSGAFAIARERQVTKEGMASRFIKSKK